MWVVILRYNSNNPRRKNSTTVNLWGFDNWHYDLSTYANKVAKVKRFLKICCYNFVYKFSICKIQTAVDFFLKGKSKLVNNKCDKKI